MQLWELCSEREEKKEKFQFKQIKAVYIQALLLHHHLHEVHHGML